MLNSLKKPGQLTIEMRFTVILGTLIAGFALFGFSTYKAMNTLNVNGPVYQRIVQGKDLIADVLPPPEYIIESYLLALQLTQIIDSAEIDTLVTRFQTLKAEYESRHRYWLDQPLEQELQTPLLQTSYQAARNFYNEAEHHFLPAIQSSDRNGSLDSLQNMHRAYEQHRAAIDQVVKFTTARNTADEAQAQDTIHRYGIALTGIFAFSVALAVALTIVISRSIVRQLGGEPNDVTALAENIAAGNLDNVIAIKANDTGSLLATMKNMQQQLLERITTDRKIADEALRIKTALDSISANVMIADNNHTIIYMNPAVHTMLRLAENDIRKSMPHFDFNKLLGSSIDTFHKNPAHQQELLANFNSTLRSEITIAGRTFYLVANPITDQRGDKLGVVVEWKDRTSEVGIEQEVAKIVNSAVQGDFTQRFDLQGKEGFFRELSIAINQLMQTSESGLQEVARVLEALSRGDLTETIANDYSGTFGQLKDDSNTTVEKLKAIINQIKNTSDSINAAAKEIAAGNDDLSHRTEQQAASLEQTAASMEELTSAVHNNAANAQQANRLAVDASDIADKGVEAVGQVVTTMNDINESSHKIGEIISVIDDIAFQTNILALNAAVEAARAGEQGKGFAVVAVEVRNLAQRAATAAGEIKHLIDDSVGKVAVGSKLVAQAGLTMEEIAASVRGVTEMMAAITSASAEQSSGIEQVNRAIAQMDSVTQQNAALVEQASASAELLEEQAQNLAAIMSSFKVDDNPHNLVNAFRSLPARTESRLPGPSLGKSSMLPKLKLLPTADNGYWEEF
ncbi:methyl-accepting chemotaxis protein [Candidatus Methylobacter oryzae]|uniref:PAS domain-containing protein n=1 Tax=Candidatus Methylobacter oryzae TaxID=2497749 RepID=A0ABY3C639_9GAMM|nr:methyl-accepting chemotaxis protein [Candidatus Methylobacter oryzae]TRW90694.1 PAS domain-containing protein [Candidatus Methylobacter oryzae]